MKQLEQGAHRNNGSVVTAKYVLDRKSSESSETVKVDMVKEVSSKHLSEKPNAHSHASAMPRNDLAVNKGSVGTQYIFVNFWNQLNVYSMLICNHNQTCIKGWFSVSKFLNIVIFIFFKQL